MSKICPKIWTKIAKNTIGCTNGWTNGWTKVREKFVKTPLEMHYYTHETAVFCLNLC